MSAAAPADCSSAQDQEVESQPSPSGRSDNKPVVMLVIGKLPGPNGLRIYKRRTRAALASNSKPFVRPYTSPGLSNSAVLHSVFASYKHLWYQTRASTDERLVNFKL